MSDRQQPKVVISIINWNGRELLETCLGSLYETISYSNFDVVIVDNGSTDGSVQMVRNEFPEVKIIQNDDNLGYSKANNQVFERYAETETEYVVLLNNDTELVEEEWLTTLVDVAESNEEIGVLGCTIVEPGGGIHYDGRYFPISNFLFPILKSKKKYNKFESDNSNDRYEFVDDVAGATFMIRTSVVEQIGKLDESYTPIYFEESDYCVRVWNAGYKVAYTSEVHVKHLRGESSKELDELYLSYVLRRNQLRFVLINYSLVWILFCLPFLILQTGRAFVERDNRTIKLRDGAKDRPLTAMKYAIKSWTDILIDIKKVASERRTRRSVSRLLK